MMKDDREPLGEQDALRQKEDLFREIFEDNFLPVEKFFANRGFRWDEARDLAQETFLMAYQGFDSYDPDRAIQPWIFGIAANIWKNEIRWRKADKRSAVELSWEASVNQEREEQVPLADLNPGALEYILEEERRKLVYDAMQKLPPRMRQCVLLRIYGGLKYREIAEALHTSIGTVKAQMFEAEKRLKRELGVYFGRWTLEEE